MNNKEISSETVAFYLKMLKSLYNYTIRKISTDIDIKTDTLYYITGGGKSSSQMNYYVMFKLRNVYPNELSAIDSAAVAISENVKEKMNNENIQAS